MTQKNKLTNICTTLTLDKVKEDIANEYKAVKKENKSYNYEQYNETVDDGKETNAILSENSDEELKRWREKRLMQFKKKKELKKDGVYVEINEKDFLPVVLKNYNVICHFYNNDFKRCEILHSHLIKLSNIHLASKFIKVEAKNCLFFMKKLSINMLPALCLFINGVHIHTSIGFQDFGNKDNFKTKDLENFLYKKNLISNMEYSESEEN